jgi:hypothetical protein
VNPATGALFPQEVTTTTPTLTTTLLDVNIPSLTAANFDFTPQSVANATKAMAGRYTNGDFNSAQPGVSNPEIIKLNSSTSDYVDITANTLTNTIAGTSAPITLTQTASLAVQYGGIAVLYIIKAKYYQLSPTQIAVQDLVAAQNDGTGPLVQAEAQALALATFPQGGGTIPEYSAVVGSSTYCPTLSGFQLPFRRDY